MKECEGTKLSLIWGEDVTCRVRGVKTKLKGKTYALGVGSVATGRKCKDLDYRGKQGTSPRHKKNLDWKGEKSAR